MAEEEVADRGAKFQAAQESDMALLDRLQQCRMAQREGDWVAQVQFDPVGSRGVDAAELGKQPMRVGRS